MTTFLPRPILKLPTNIINGMIPIHIEYCDASPRYMFFGSYTVSYRFKLKEDQKNYKNNEWQSHDVNFMSHRFFLLKTPLFLLSYILEINLSINLVKREESLSNIIKIPITSDNYTINIPSILIESSHKKGDKIEYIADNEGFVRSGIIMDILDNDKIKIGTDPDHYDGSMLPFDIKKIVTMNVSNVYRNAISINFVVDITDRIKAETDLILQTDDLDKTYIYHEIRRSVSDYCFDEMRRYRFDHNGERHYLQYMKTMIAMNIYQFLFEPEYSYRIQCIFDSNALFREEQWRYHILKTYKDFADGLDTENPQWPRIEGKYYSCDMCRVEMNYYEYGYHCTSNHQHDFCISCIYSLISQYYTMKPFILELLSDKLDNNSIDEIVTFCVGKVNKFVTKPKGNDNVGDNGDIDMMVSDNYDNMDDKDLIDDTKAVGSKRSMQIIDNYPRKRRRLQ